MLCSFMGAAPVVTKGAARTVAAVRAIVLVQLRLATGLSSEEYIATQGWLGASLSRCPLHPAGGCGFARHTAYPRSPSGAWVARYRCPLAHCTFSLLPDCLPSRFVGTLPALEQVVAQSERLGVAAAGNQVRPAQAPDAVTLESAVRWVRRRARSVHAGLRCLVGLIPKIFTGIEPTVTALRLHLSALPVLGLLREIAAAHLHALPPPLGFGPRPQRRWIRPEHLHQSTGPDPP
jgi:hypothetical protein